MANTQAYFGFTQYQGGAGGAPTFAQSVRRIASSSGAIYTGDPVMPAVSSANGYIVQASPGTTTLAGIFVGCKYLNTSLGRTVWSNYWPGSGATGDVEAYVMMTLMLVSSFRQAQPRSQSRVPFPRRLLAFRANTPSSPLERATRQLAVPVRIFRPLERLSLSHSPLWITKLVSKTVATQPRSTAT